MRKKIFAEAARQHTMDEAGIDSTGSVALTGTAEIATRAAKMNDMIEMVDFTQARTGSQIFSHLVNVVALVNANEWPDPLKFLKEQQQKEASLAKLSVSENVDKEFEKLHDSKNPLTLAEFKEKLLELKKTADSSLEQSILMFFLPFHSLPLAPVGNIRSPPPGS